MPYGATLKESRNNVNYVLCACTEPVPPPFLPVRLAGVMWGKITAAAAIFRYSFDTAVESRAASHGLSILRGSRKCGNSPPNLSLRNSRHRRH